MYTSLIITNPPLHQILITDSLVKIPALSRFPLLMNPKLEKLK